MAGFVEPVLARVEMGGSYNSGRGTTVQMVVPCNNVGEMEGGMQWLAFACNCLDKHLVGFSIFVLLLAIYIFCASDTSV
jgi:hypothetical protein